MTLQVELLQHAPRDSCRRASTYNLDEQNDDPGGVIAAH
jgi:hypothetical protein